MNMEEYINLINTVLIELDDKERYRTDQRHALTLAYASLAMVEYYESQIEALTKSIKA